MAVPLDFVVFVVVLGLTLMLLLANYVVYLARASRHLASYALATLVLGGLVAGVVIGPMVLALGEQYGPAVLLSRWGFAFGWAFLVSLGSSGAAVLERRSEGRIAIMLTISATLLLGFTLASGLIFSEQSLPPLPTSLVNLGLAAVFTSVFKWMYEKRLEKQRKKKGLLARLVGAFRG